MKKSIFLLFLIFTTVSFGLTPEEYCTDTPQNKCVTPYGQILGKSENVIGFSNCRSECVKKVENYVPAKDLKLKENVYSGLSWQCVEYARRWWMLKHGIRFPSINTANEIYDLDEGTRLTDNTKIELQSFPNSSPTQPKVGDLLVYSKQPDNPSFQYGHVAVIVSLNLTQGYVDVAEQNYNNKAWESRTHYSRRLVLEFKDKTYTIYDIAFSEFDSSEDNEIQKDMILGWVSPKV